MQKKLPGGGGIKVLSIVQTPIEELLQLAIYPNPTDKMLFCDYSLTQETEVSCTVVDAFGRHVLTMLPASKQNRGNHKLSVDCSGLSAGFILQS